MNRTETTSRHNVRFYIEQACDFDDDGRIVAGCGWYAGLIVGRNDMSGIWFESREQAMDAIADFRGAA